MNNLKIALLSLVLLLTNGLVYSQDWANTLQFKDENSKVGISLSGEKRVVFMGNSITIGWLKYSPDFFQDKPYINRGISGQTTPQMLVRFRQDVINLKPSLVVILAGTNDIAGNTGFSTNEMILDNIISMTELAHFNNIKVILCSLLPAFDYPWRKDLAPAEKIVDLNIHIKKYANQKGVIYLDYFTPMADERNGLKAEYTYDGVHPNAAGYILMGTLAESAIKAALQN